MNGMEELDAIALERVVIDALLPAPDARFVDTPDWVQLSTPSIPYATGNGVYLAKLDAAEADARILELTRGHVERRAGFRWFVGPSSTPHDLAERLRRAGFLELGPSLGMAMPVPIEVPPIPAGVALHEVGPAEVEAFARLSERAWAREPAFGRALEGAMTRALARGPEVMRSWLVTLEGEPVGTTTLRLLAERRIGYLQGAAVVPERRRSGIYRAMVHHRLALLHALGFDHAVIWAAEGSSALGCRSLGFRRVCRAHFFEWRAS
ncbi:GNAT family N-acetyltransferase [Nannocystaceae bacterium ST9]